MDTAQQRLNEGAEAHRQGDLARAAAAYRDVLAAAPDTAVALQLLAQIELQEGRAETALARLEKADLLQPGSLEIRFHLGRALRAMGRLDESLALFKALAEAHPHEIGVLVQHAEVLSALGHYGEAARVFAAAASFAPEDPDFHMTVAVAYLRSGDANGALEHYERALALRPGDFNTVIARTPVFFSLGRLQEGWKAYSFRHLLIGGGRPFPSPAWCGEPLAGKRLLLSFEQGLGEQIMFASMLPDVIRAGANVVAEVHERLIPLFARSFPDVSFVPWLKPPHAATSSPDIDFHCPFGDVGRWLRTDLAAFPAHTGYLRADAQRTAAFSAQFLAAAGGKPVVGLAWASQARHSGAGKSISLSALTPLLQRKDIHVVSLQHGDTAADLAAVPKELRPSVLPAGAADDLDALTAAVAAVDAVVSISTATAHIAGALGKPVALMLSREPTWQYWYWFADREKNPWYPSVHPFVQSRAGQWDGVVARVCAALPSLLPRA